MAWRLVDRHSLTGTRRYDKPRPRFPRRTNEVVFLQNGRNPLPQHGIRLVRDVHRESRAAIRCLFRSLAAEAAAAKRIAVVGCALPSLQSTIPRLYHRAPSVG